MIEDECEGDIYARWEETINERSRHAQIFLLFSSWGFLRVLRVDLQRACSSCHLAILGLLKGLSASVLGLGKGEGLLWDGELLN